MTTALRKAAMLASRMCADAKALEDLLLAPSLLEIECQPVTPVTAPSVTPWRHRVVAQNMGWYPRYLTYIRYPDRYPRYAVV